MMSNSSLRSGGARHVVDRLIRVGAKAACNPAAYWRIIHSLQSETGLLHHRNVGQHHDATQVRRVIIAAIRLAPTEAQWIRAPETYLSAANMSLFQQWIGFAQHLFQRYECPNYFASCWLKPAFQSWWFQLHAHLGEGRSPRRFRFPGTGYTDRPTSRWLMQAPSDATPSQAYRWAQVMALQKQTKAENDAQQARQLMTRMPLVENCQDEAFWSDATQFFVKHPMDDDELDRTIGVAKMLRFTSAQRVFGRRMYERPLEPKLLLSTLTLSGVRQLVDNWRQEYMDRNRDLLVRLNPNDIPWQRLPIANGCFGCWQIVQLTTPRELLLEGQAQKHCVGSYARFCRSGRSSIWSLRHVGEQIQRAVTIEVTPATNKVRQIRGYGNRAPTADERALIVRWAEASGLTIARRT